MQIPQDRDLKTMNRPRMLSTRLHLVKSAAPLLVAAIVVAGVGMWLSGCDFNKVEQEAATSTQDVLAALAAADTEAEASAAIQALVEKTDLDGSSGASMYRDFGLKKAERAGLAVSLAAYNRGELSSEASLASVFQNSGASENAVTADINATMMVFKEVVADALRDPDDPNAAFILAIATNLPRVPASSSALDHAAKASPLQARLFSAWLTKHGPLMDVYAGKRSAPAGLLQAQCDVDETCPGAAAKARICHKPGTPAQQTLCVALPAVEGHLGHGDACGVCEEIHDQGSAQ